MSINARSRRSIQTDRHRTKKKARFTACTMKREKGQGGPALWFYGASAPAVVRLNCYRMAIAGGYFDAIPF